MTLARVRFAAVALCMTLFASSASAQVFGTFSWQMQPYCNVVTMTITQVPSGFTIDGFDEQCAALKRASAVGMALINPDGTVGINFTTVTAPGSKGVHVAAVISPVTGSGTWIDSVGNNGSFVLGGSVPALPPRPIPTSGVAPATITSIEIASSAVGASEIADDAVGASELAPGAVRAGHLGTITRRSITSANIAPGGAGSATANCNAGELVLTGGNDASSANEVFVVASRNSGTTGWTVFAHNDGAVNRTITTHVYCLAP